MNNKILHRLSSPQATIALLILYIVLMAVATVVEKNQGTPVAKALFYYSPLFLFLQLLLGVNFVLLTYNQRQQFKKKGSYLLIHFAFLIIMAGASITHFWGQEGTIHIREGEQTSVMMLKKGTSHESVQLPFTMELIDFKLMRYPGSQSPSSYESLLRLHTADRQFEHKIYMNNVLDLEGYRFYQASYDPDERGTILAVNHDVAGRTVTYVGYLLLFVGLGLMLFDRHSRFYHLWKTLHAHKLSAVLWVMILSCSIESHAQHHYISESHAQRFGSLPMQAANGRFVPVNTFASEIVRKFKAEKLLGKLTPEQFLLSIMTHPADWSIIPLIEVEDSEVAALFGWKKGRIAYREAFDAKGNYKLSGLIEKIYHKNPAERNRLDKEVLQIDDRINIFHELLTHRLMRLYPNPADTLTHRWLAVGEVHPTDTLSTIRQLSATYMASVARAAQTGEWHEPDTQLKAIRDYQLKHQTEGLYDPDRLQTEVYYNTLQLPHRCQKGYLLLGVLLLISSFVSRPHATKRTWKNGLRISLSLGVGLCFVCHTVSLGMRWYISGYAPWSNTYETMVALAWAGVLGGLIFVRKNSFVTALATLFGGIVLFVSGLNWMDPQITPLVPVLKSPWLMAHVASLVMAYGFLGICCMMGTAYLYVSLSKHPSVSPLLKQMTLINELSMILGIALMTVGIFLGAVWANESWGRYWSWDPKETWALISMVVYAVVLHLRWFRLTRNDWQFNLLSQQAFLSILMTFLGVNYFLSGMHSYGSHDALSAIPTWGYLLFGLFFILPGLLSYMKGKR